MTEKKKRTIHYSFKATPEEDAIIQKKMKTFGIKNQSAFIRALVLNGYVLKLDLPELHDAVRLMGSLSNNVNQIARRLNERESIFEMEIDDIKDRQEELRTILSSIMQMTNSLKLAQITEGVETAEQFENLRDMGCDMFQGYYFAKPMEERDFMDFLEKHRGFP